MGFGGKKKTEFGKNKTTNFKNQTLISQYIVL